MNFIKSYEELDASEKVLRKSAGTLLYLKNLQKEDGEERDPCPVCREPLSNKV